jgi:hypothetical protein
VTGERSSFGSVSVHAGGDAWARCSTYEDSTPILSLETGPLSVSVSVAGSPVVSGQVMGFARELAAEAAKFAAECERLHSSQQHPGAATGDPAQDAGEPVTAAC